MEVPLYIYIYIYIYIYESPRQIFLIILTFDLVIDSLSSFYIFLHLMAKHAVILQKCPQENSQYPKTDKMPSQILLSKGH